MNRENATVEQVGIMPQQQHDNGSVRFRTTFEDVIKNLRVALTGKTYSQNRMIKVFDHALMCDKHFNRMLPKLFLGNTRATVLSQVHEENAEKYIIDLMNDVEGWLIREVYTCEDCRIEGSYQNISEICGAVETFFYFNFHRAVGGFEAQMQSTMHQSFEHTNIEQDKRSGFIGNVFRKGGGRG